MAVKVHHAKKTLQLLDVLGGGGDRFDCDGMTGYGGQSCRWNCVAKNFHGGDCKKAFLKVDGETIGGQSIKKASKWRRCVCLFGEPTREASMYANTPSRPSTVRSIMCWKVCAALDNLNGQRWVPAFFSHFRACKREAKKRAQKRKEKERKKSESAKHERKKREFVHFPASHTGDLVSESKAAQQGEKQGSWIKCAVQYIY
jgi:hypothetical protein